WKRPAGASIGRRCLRLLLRRRCRRKKQSENHHGCTGKMLHFNAPAVSIFIDAFSAAARWPFLYTREPSDSNRLRHLGRCAICASQGDCAAQDVALGFLAVCPYFGSSIGTPDGRASVSRYSRPSDGTQKLSENAWSFIQ